MAELFYAYLPVFMKQFHEGIADEFPGFENRLIDSAYNDQELLEKLWTF